MKVCTCCKQQLSLDQFNKKGPRLHSWCKGCHKTYKDAHYEQHKAMYVQKVAQRKKELFAWVQQLKESAPCADCGQKYPGYVMDYDHVRDKEFNIAQGIGTNGYSKTKILAEIMKCELVCANCHRIRTHNRLAAVDELVESPVFQTGHLAGSNPVRSTQAPLV